MSFFQELRRRNVVKVGIAYLVVAWMLIQIAVSVFPALQLPDWSVTFVTAMLILGFPVALLLAWAYELTPDGIKRTRHVPLEQSIAHLAGQKLNYIVTALLVAAIGFLFVDNYVFDEDAATRARDLMEGEFPAAAAAGAGSAVPAAARQPLDDSIAVLPFDNLSPNADDAYFAAGLHEEVLNQLAKLRNLKVISRSSMLRYTQNRPPIREIADELNVEAVMEGSVRYAGNQLMVTAQLIDPATDVHIWSETFRADRDNIDEIFSIQIDIATAIATALGAEITPADQSRIGRMPTESSAAYARYLRARDHYGKTEFAEAIRELGLAVDIDPEFADAYAVRAVIYAYGQITSNARGALLGMGLPSDDFQALALADASRALELYDGAAMAWVARALTHQFHFRWNEAEQAHARALALNPNDPAVLHEYAMFELFRGDTERALALIRQAAPVDPNGVLTLSYWAMIAMGAGQPDEALHALERCLAADPASAMTNSLAGVFTSDQAAAARHLRATEDLAIGYDAIFLATAAQGYLRLGRERDAERVLDRYGQFAGEAEIGMADWGQYHLLRGDLDRAYAAFLAAIESLEAGQADAGFFALQGFATSPDPRLDEARFQDLLERLRALRAN